jgi:hypothetical protein
MGATREELDRVGDAFLDEYGIPKRRHKEHRKPERPPKAEPALPEKPWVQLTLLAVPNFVSNFDLEPVQNPTQIQDPIPHKSETDSVDARASLKTPTPTPLEGLAPSSSLGKSKGSGVRPSRSDDEKPKRKPLLNPDMEFGARIFERHGPTVSAVNVLKIVLKELSVTGVPLTDFLAHDEQTTTAPAQLRNPAGYYRMLARIVANHGNASVLEDLMQTQDAAMRFVQPQKDEWKPPACCQDGILPDGSCCTCEAGRLRAQLAEYAEAAKAGK